MSKYDSEQTERVSGLENEGLGVESFGSVDEYYGYYALVADNYGEDGDWSIIHESGLGFVTGSHGMTEQQARARFDELFRQYCEDQVEEGV